MARIVRLVLRAVDLPFRKPFKHAAAERSTSSSLFLECVSDSGEVGFGETLPRVYVTGESRDDAFECLRDRMLPRLFELEFADIGDVHSFLATCDGKAPTDWMSRNQPQAAAWCAVDLALLDTFGRVFGQPVVIDGHQAASHRAYYSAVISSEASLKTLLLIRLAGIRQVKLKVEQTSIDTAVRKCRRILGRQCDIRVDANMAWDVEQAVTEMQHLSRSGIRSFEQPIAADDLNGLSEVVRRTGGLELMADESLTDKVSLDALIDQEACTAVNVRISKCGGLFGAYQRCRQALDAGLTLQIGCHVGESSLISSAQLALVQAVPEVTYLEGCFGRHLLAVDPGAPALQFGLRGRPPQRPTGHGFGVTMDTATLDQWTVRRETLEC